MATTSPSNNKTNAILAWLFAPITSFIWMNDADEFLKHHAKQSLYWGVADIVVWGILFVLSFLIIGACLMPIWAIIDLVVRVMGIVKANNGEKWVVPVIGGMVK
jgi:uncharacterized protein